MLDPYYSIWFPTYWGSGNQRFHLISAPGCFKQWDDHSKTESLAIHKHQGWIGYQSSHIKPWTSLKLQHVLGHQSALRDLNLWYPIWYLAPGASLLKTAEGNLQKSSSDRFAVETQKQIIHVPVPLHRKTEGEQTWLFQTRLNPEDKVGASKKDSSKFHTSDSCQSFLLWVMELASRVSSRWLVRKNWVVQVSEISSPNH